MSVFRAVMLLVIASLMICSPRALALSPQIKLPEWHQTRIFISDWKPDTGLLTVSVSITANLVDLSEISSQLHAPTELKMPVNRHQRPQLKTGEKLVLMHQLQAKSGFYGWFELDVKARPDRDALLQSTAKQQSDQPLTAHLIKEEIKTISQPLYIGTSMPVLLRDDIALSTMPETAFTNDFSQDGNNYYLWFPPDSLGRGITAEGLKIYATALQSGSFQRTDAAAKMLLRRFESEEQLVSIEKSNGETFSLPSAVAIDLIKANQLTLQALSANSGKTLAQALAKMPPSYTRPFLSFNLAVMEQSHKNKAQARKYFEQALADLPAWPLARNLLSKLKK